MSERIAATDNDDSEQDRRDRFADELRDERETKMRDHFAQLDRRDRTGPNW